MPAYLVVPRRRGVQASSTLVDVHAIAATALVVL